MANTSYVPRKHEAHHNDIVSLSLGDNRQTVNEKLFTVFKVQLQNCDICKMICTRSCCGGCKGISIVIFCSPAIFLYQWVCVSCDANNGFLVAKWVSPGGKPVRHWTLQRPWVPLPWDLQEGSGRASSHIWPGDIYTSSGSVKFM